MSVILPTLTARSPAPAAAATMTTLSTLPILAESMIE